MHKSFSSLAPKKSAVGLLALALVIAGVGASADNLLNSPAGGYLVCINSATKTLTHPGTDTCPRGSKKLVLGAQGKAGTDGLTGATGLSGTNGSNGTSGKDGKTLWNGTTDPISTWGAPGDMFINSVTRTLFGPKSIDGLWPIGVSMVGATGAQGLVGAKGADGPSGPVGPGGSGATGAQGPAGNGATGAQGPAGTNGTNGADGSSITELLLCDGADAGTVADEKCKVGMTGPGGGLIFFVDYNDQYAGFNYLEVAPSSCETNRTWVSSGFQSTSVAGVTGWAARAAGRGSTNTDAIIAADTPGSVSDNAAKYAKSCASGGKTDWFLGSTGEMKLMYDNLQGLAGFVVFSYWSSSQLDSTSAMSQNFASGLQGSHGKSSGSNYVRPVRAF